MDLKVYYKCRSGELHSIQASNQVSVQQALADVAIYLAETNVVWDNPLLGLLQGGKHGT